MNCDESPRRDTGRECRTNATGVLAPKPAFLTLLRLQRAIDPCLLRCAGPGGHPPCSTYCSNTPPRASLSSLCERGPLARFAGERCEKCRLSAESPQRVARAGQTTPGQRAFTV